MAGIIGIKVANGDFYPILTEGARVVKKRLVLTTVHDRQESVQIDLYRSVAKSLLDAQYIGSLVVENIKPRPKGEASVEMVISCDANGAITADACDLDAGPGGGRQMLNVSLRTADSSQKNANFNLNGKTNILTGDLYEQSQSEEEEDKRKFPWIVMAAATLFVILVIALLWFFFLGGRDLPAFAGSQKSEQPAAYNPPPPEPAPAPAPEPAPAPAPEPAPAPAPEPPPPPEPVALPPPVEEVPVIEAPSSPPPARPQQTVRRQRPPAPVSSYRVPAVIPREGVAYRIRWGDTLWDISEAFYRNPWLYPQIARHNNIRNPDLIISGRTIRIPPRN